MDFPLQFRFKLFALTPQISVEDANGATVFFIKEKLFKWRETINVFADETQAEQIATIKADRIIDWSARYLFTDADGQSLGAVGRKGFRSLFRAHYELFDRDGAPAGTIREENPSAKVFDALLSEIPLLGLLSGYLFHPRYLLSGPAGEPVMRLHKRPSLVERRFEVKLLSERNPEVTERDVMALLMLCTLERRRG